MLQGDSARIRHRSDDRRCVLVRCLLGAHPERERRRRLYALPSKM